MKKKQSKKVEQLEFDLISPWLGGNAVSQEIEKLLQGFSKLSEEKKRLASLAHRLHHEDLLGPLFSKPTNELAELKVLIGPRDWKKSERTWKRRVKENVTRVRKVILSLKSLYNLK